MYFIWYNYNWFKGENSMYDYVLYKEENVDGKLVYLAYNINTRKFEYVLSSQVKNYVNMIKLANNLYCMCLLPLDKDSPDKFVSFSNEMDNKFKELVLAILEKSNGDKEMFDLIYYCLYIYKLGLIRSIHSKERIHIEIVNYVKEEIFKFRKSK